MERYSSGRSFAAMQQNGGFLMKKVFMIFMMILLSSMVNAQSLEEIQCITEQFPPFNYRDSDGNTRVLNIDILIKYGKKLGSGMFFVDDWTPMNIFLKKLEVLKPTTSVTVGLY